MKCGCGGSMVPHKVGEAGCKREWAIPPRKIKGKEDTWLVTEVRDGKICKSRCTEYTLRYQRMYAQHEDGQWSRPKGGVSVNSLPDET